MLTSLNHLTLVPTRYLLLERVLADQHEGHLVVGQAGDIEQHENGPATNGKAVVKGTRLIPPTAKDMNHAVALCEQQSADTRLNHHLRNLIVRSAYKQRIEEKRLRK